MKHLLTEQEPIWVFQVKDTEKIITGFLPKAKLGNLEVKAKPCSVKALFEIEDEDIKITKSSGFSFNLGKNACRMLPRAFLFNVIRAKINPYISHAELSI